MSLTKGKGLLLPCLLVALFVAGCLDEPFKSEGDQALYTLDVPEFNENVPYLISYTDEDGNTATDSLVDVAWAKSLDDVSGLSSLSLKVEPAANDTINADSIITTDSITVVARIYENRNLVAADSALALDSKSGELAPSVSADL